MPQVKVLTLSPDGGVTSVALTPDSNSESGFRASSEDAAIASGNVSVLISLRSNGTKKSHYLKLIQPLVRTNGDTGEQYVIDNNYVEVTFKSSTSSTVAEKTALIGLANSLLDEVDVKSALERSKSFY
jgi:hypothetical protein